MSSFHRSALCVLSIACAGMSGCIIVSDRSVRSDSVSTISSVERAYQIDATLEADPGASLSCRGAWKGQGDWEDDTSARKYLELGVRDGGESRSVVLMQSEEFDGLPVDEGELDLRFVLHRPAGTLTFEGRRKSVRSRTASGQVFYVADPVFTERLREICGTAPTVTQSLRLAVNGISEEYVSSLAASGYRGSVDDVLRLRNHGVTAETVASFKRPDGTVPDTSELVRYRSHGVSGAFARDVREVDPGISAEELVRLRNHGVSAEFFRAIVGSGLTDDPDQVIRLRNAGVSADYAAALRACGYPATVDEVIRLRTSGVSSEFVCATMAPGYAPLPTTEIIALRHRGVSAETVKRLRLKE